MQNFFPDLIKGVGFSTNQETVCFQGKKKNNLNLRLVATTAIYVNLLHQSPFLIACTFSQILMSL